MKTSRLLTLVAAAMISGCASGSAIVTGTTRPSTRADSVKIYLDPPAEYETIGLVRAESSSGWTKQGDTDYALRELKKRAAKIGANGIILTSTGTKSQVVVVNGTGGSSESQAVEGRAVYVSREK
jgi:uncharacterized protein YbjQ (UPF0145 family)